MKKTKSIQLIEQLEADTRQVILQTNYLLKQDPELLTMQPGEGKWSIAQVIEHLNSYGRYYLPLIENPIRKSHHKADELFTPGLLGDYFTKSMLPKSDGRISNKMQTPKAHRPSVDIDSKKVIDEFLKQEYLLLELLEKAKQTDIGRIRIPISIAKFIRIKLGDTFRFLIAHHQRHFVQIKNTGDIVNLKFSIVN